MEKHMGRGNVLGIGLVVLVLGAGGVWGGKAWLEQRTENALHARLADGTPEQLRDALLSPDKKKSDAAVEVLKQKDFSELRQTIHPEDLTEDQRRQLHTAMHEVMRAHMDERVNEYFEAPEEERQKVLDRHLDEMVEEFERMRAEREARGDDPNAPPDGERRQPPLRDRQEAKERMEGGDPDQQKRMFGYFGRMRARAAERGIDLPGPGGRRPPGGPPGGRGGSGRGR